jgi:ferredoxin-type protein NapG
MADDKRMNRRSFFLRGFREILAPLADSLEEKARELEKIIPKDTPAPKPAVSLKLLRPPGALPEHDFLSTCIRCGNCVRACPAEAIKIDEAGLMDGAPYIDASSAPCVVCSTLECMTVCPSGALVATRMLDIDMGTARWDSSSCVRSSGQSCSVCVDECPIGEVAIRLEGNAVRVIDDGCVGCGVCQHRCPTSPKSIVVVSSR